jgi:hypothetical protein
MPIRLILQEQLNIPIQGIPGSATTPQQQPLAHHQHDR